VDPKHLGQGVRVPDFTDTRVMGLDNTAFSALQGASLCFPPTNILRRGFLRMASYSASKKLSWSDIGVLRESLCHE
jgi:hypothetical protein